MTLTIKLAKLSGRRVTAEEIARLRNLAPGIPDEAIDLLSRYPIIGVSFSLPDEEDSSELGAEVRVLNPDEIVDEATNAYPGIAALPAGFVPLGACLEGSGDPYFVHCSGGEFVRIPHGAVTEDNTLDRNQIEVVRQSFTEFLEASEPYP